ncbi:MAG: DNA-binding protein [Bacteroidales bacterium]|nr:DNA-binding protein [Bacteroidales bacterium]
MENNQSISTIERQNVLNNRFAVEAIQKALNIEALHFNGQFCFTKQMVASFYEVDERTIERYLESHEQELKHNGYFLCKGKLLKDLKLQFAPVINVATKTTVIGLFNFRSFLNVGMLLSESEKAKQVRSLILDIVIATINEKSGGGTKYINRRDVNYIPSAVAEINHRKSLTSAINQCVDGHHTMKYAQITDYIYKAVFKENAKEYREILNLKNNDNVRETLYSEVLLMIAAFENGVGYEIRERFKESNGQLLSMQEVYGIINKFAEHPFQQPHLNDARAKMASRDLSFRDAYHGNIAEYLKAVTPEEYERFIGSESIDFDSILEANQEVLKRLKQAEE